MQSKKSALIISVSILFIGFMMVFLKAKFEPLNAEPVSQMDTMTCGHKWPCACIYKQDLIEMYETNIEIDSNNLDSSSTVEL